MSQEKNSSYGSPSFPPTMLDKFFDETPLTYSFRILDNILNQNYPDALQLQRNRHFKVDIIEMPTEYNINAELPGMSKEEIDVSIKNNILSISTEKLSNEENKTNIYHIRERSYGSLSRSLKVPKDTDGDNITCSYVDGILKLVLQKLKRDSVGESVKKIKVN